MLRREEKSSCHHQHLISSVSMVLAFIDIFITFIIDSKFICLLIATYNFHSWNIILNGKRQIYVIYLNLHLLCQTFVFTVYICHFCLSARLNIQYPMLFKLTNTRTQRETHCGVLEFIAEEGRVYLPYWVCCYILIPKKK